MTVAERSLPSCIWAYFLIGSHIIPEQRHSQPTLASLCQFRVCACLSVTCHLHFWQNNRGLLCATVVTQGWNWHWIRVRTQSLLWRRKFTYGSCQDWNYQPLDHESKALPTSCLDSLFEICAMMSSCIYVHMFLWWIMIMLGLFKPRQHHQKLWTLIIDVSMLRDHSLQFGRKCEISLCLQELSWAVSDFVQTISPEPFSCF